MSMLNQFGAWASILGFLVPVAIWLKRRAARGRICIETALEPGPCYPEVPRELGFTPSAVKITVVNESEQTIKVSDIRLMFCGEYGVPVLPKAPPGRHHPELPSDLNPGTVEHWHIDAEKLSESLLFLHRPPSTTVSKSRKVKLHARCISGTGKVYKSPSFFFR